MRYRFNPTTLDRVPNVRADARHAYGLSQPPLPPKAKEFPLSPTSCQRFITRRTNCRLNPDRPYLQLIGVGIMDLFQAERIATVNDQSAETCRRCGTKLVLVRVIIDSETGTTYRMFECECGERIWND